MYFRFKIRANSVGRSKEGLCYCSSALNYNRNVLSSKQALILKSFYCFTFASLLYFQSFDSPTETKCGTTQLKLKRVDYPLLCRSLLQGHGFCVMVNRVSEMSDRRQSKSNICASTGAASGSW